MTSWGPLKFGEKCDRHPPMKPRGLDARTTILKQINPITGEEMRSGRGGEGGVDTSGTRAYQRANASSSESWYKHHYHDPLASTATNNGAQMVDRRALEDAAARQVPAGMRKAYQQQFQSQQQQQPFQPRTQRNDMDYDDVDFQAHEEEDRMTRGRQDQHQQQGSRFRDVVNSAVHSRVVGGQQPAGASGRGAPPAPTAAAGYGGMRGGGGRAGVSSLYPDDLRRGSEQDTSVAWNRRPGVDALPYYSSNAVPDTIRDTTVRRVGNGNVPSFKSIGSIALEAIKRERALRRQLAEAARGSKMAAQGQAIPLSTEEKLEQHVDSLLVQIKAKVDSVAGPNGDAYHNRLTIRKIVSQHMFISGSPSGRGAHNGDTAHDKDLILRSQGGWGAAADTYPQYTPNARTLHPEDRLRLSGPSDTSDPANSLDLQQLRRVLERGFGITQTSEEDYQSLFDRFDLNEDGILSVNELCWGLVFGCSSADGRASNVGRRLGVTGINQITNPGARDAVLRIKKRIIQRFILANSHTDEANLFTTGHMRRITQSLRNASIFPLTRVRLANMPAGVSLSSGNSIYSYLLQQQQQMGINADGTMSVITAVDLLNGLQKIGVPQVSMQDVLDIIHSLAPAPSAVMNAEGAHFIPIDAGRGSLTAARGADMVVQGVTPQRLIKAFRGVVPRRRRAIIAEAFNQLDVDGNGYIALSEIVDRFDAEQHPAVLSGDATKEDIVKQFMMNWKTSIAIPEDVPTPPPNTRYGGGAALQARRPPTDSVNYLLSESAANDALRRRSVSDVANEMFSEVSSTTISWREFLNYYKDIGDEIVSDDYFVFMMRNVWHLSSTDEGTTSEGGYYKDLTNTTCKRVLVSYVDGSQRVEEIKNDLGLRVGDMADIRRRLEEQGHRGIKEVALYQ